MRKNEYSPRNIDRFLNNNRRSILANKYTVLAERLTDDEKIAVQMLLDEGAYRNAKEAIRAIHDGDVRIYNDNLKEVLREEVVDGVYDFDFLSNYIDYEQLAEDTRTNLYVIEDNGYTVIVY